MHEKVGIKHLAWPLLKKVGSIDPVLLQYDNHGVVDVVWPISTYGWYGYHMWTMWSWVWPITSVACYCWSRWSITFFVRFSKTLWKILCLVSTLMLCLVSYCNQSKKTSLLSLEMAWWFCFSNRLEWLHVATPWCTPLSDVELQNLDFYSSSWMLSTLAAFPFFSCLTATLTCSDMEFVFIGSCRLGWVSIQSCVTVGSGQLSTDWKCPCPFFTKSSAIEAVDKMDSCILLHVIDREFEFHELIHF